MSKRFKIWDCKILVPISADLPAGFDSPPRQAAIEAIEAEGIEVLHCASGWGGKLSDEEQAYYDEIDLCKSSGYLEKFDE